MWTKVVSLIEYKVLYWSTSRPNDKVEMGKSYSCIMIFIINVDIMICIMCDVLLLKCAPSVVLMFKYVLCTLLESNMQVGLFKATYFKLM
jgi:hypothetical protein